jgi:hypothetical protein
MSPRQSSAQASQHPQPTTKHDQMCQQRPWDPYDTSDPSSYSDSDSDDYCVAVVHPTHQDNPKSERPYTRQDTTDPGCFYNGHPKTKDAFKVCPTLDPCLLVKGQRHISGFLAYREPTHQFFLPLEFSRSARGLLHYLQHWMLLTPFQGGIITSS